MRLVRPAGLEERGEGWEADEGRRGQGRSGLGFDDLVHHHVRVPPTEGNLPTVQLPEEDAETVDITLCAGSLTTEELWSLQSTVMITTEDQ